MMFGKRILPDIDVARFFFDSCGGVLDESPDNQIDPRYILSCQVQRRNQIIKTARDNLENAIKQTLTPQHEWRLCETLIKEFHRCYAMANGASRFCINEEEL